MCDGSGDIEDLAPASQYQINKTSRTSYNKCKKCEEKPIVLLQKKDPFCKPCFFEYCNHKFRSTIGKTKKVKHGDKVLLACSGGRKSTAMLHMTKQALDSASAKQISFTPAVLYIDETVLSPFLSDQSNYLSEDIVCNLEEYGYPVFLSYLEMVCKLNNEEFYWKSSSWKSPDKIPCLEAQKWFQVCLKDMSLTERYDLVKHMRLLLMTEIANRMGYNYLFLGDSGNSLAVNLLTDISLGRGSQISSDTNFYDSRYKVPICRPIREFLDKELLMYNHLHNCSFIVIPDLLTKVNSTACIQKLTECFISELQEQFPATVFTIFRTGGKLSLDSSFLTDEVCIVCKSKLDNVDPDPCSAVEALRISESVSAVKSNIKKKESNSLSDLSTSFEIMNFSKNLCYGCSTLFRHKMLKGNNKAYDLCQNLLRLVSANAEPESEKNDMESLKDDTKIFYF